MLMARIRSMSGWWLAAATISVLATCAWLRGPSVEYLALGGAATVVALVLAWRGPRPGGWGWTALVGLALAQSVAIQPQLSLRTIESDWSGWERTSADRSLQAIQRALDDAIARANRDATEALTLPAERAGAFAVLGDAPGQRYDHGLVVTENGKPFAWRGMVRVPFDDAPQGISLGASPVYLELRVTRAAGNRRATAVVLLDAVPPGDSLAETLGRSVASRGALSRFVFGRPGPADTSSQILRYQHDGARVLDVGLVALGQGEVAFATSERARLVVSALLAIALLALLIAVWRSTPSLTIRLAILALGLVTLAIVPVNQYSNISRLFDPAAYYAPLGRQLTASAGALSISGALALLGLIAVLRRRRRQVSRVAAGVVVLLVVGLGPFLLRELARGIHIPQRGVDPALWLMWEIPIFLAGVVVLLAGASAGAVLVGRTRGLPPWIAPALAGVAALIGPIVWEAPGQWPWWYTFLWIGAVAALALARQSRRLIVVASTVAALGAVTLVWGRSARGRVSLAEQDLRGLSRPNEAAIPLLQRFGDEIEGADVPADRLGLLQAYVTSALAAASYPVLLASWDSVGSQLATFQTASLAIPGDSMRAVIAEARAASAPVMRVVPGDVAAMLVLASVDSSGKSITVAVAPPSRLFRPDPYARLLGLDVDESAEPPYELQLRERVPLTTADTVARWRRDAEGSELHGDWSFSTGSSAWRGHAEVELRPLAVLIQRGTLIVILDLAIVGILWAVGVIADGRAGRWVRARRRRWWRSYRARLSLALFAFFIIPAAAFAAWSSQQLASDARQARELLVTETLRSVAPDTTPAWLDAEGRRLRTPLLMYADGELRRASDPLVEVMAPFGRLLDPLVEIALTEEDEGTTSRMQSLGGDPVLVGFRPLQDGVSRSVLAAPARADELSLGRRRRDLGILVLFATAVGALAALWLSGIAARQLAQPIRNLREAARAIAGGERVPALGPDPTVEFQPVFSAFRRMANDLHASRSELEEAQRRTTAVLRNVASGVVAVDPDGVVSLANPRAEALLGQALPAGSVLRDRDLLASLREFAAGMPDDRELEMEIDGRQLHGWMTKLSRGGIVLTVDDVTELARAQRVLAWGEMARQVAHEIKNPLTPIRLGVQHLKRARADNRVDFDKVLEANVARILSEIDRLDEIARAFSRYGSAPAEREAPEPTDVTAVVQDVVALERMGAGDGVRWSVRAGDAPAVAMARRTELKEVLLNLLENARHAHARNVSIEIGAAGGEARVVLRIRDDGEGIPPDVLPRVFEPHFSTRTSGSGLGLAISRQIIDGWGGEIAIQSEPGNGTVVTIALTRA